MQCSAAVGGHGWRLHCPDGPLSPPPMVDSAPTPGTVVYMENNVTPGLDTPSTRILIGLLIGVVLTAGAFVGGFLALGNSPEKPASLTTAAAPKDPEAVKLEVWHLAAGRGIGPVLTGLSSITEGNESLACNIVSPERLESLGAVALAPNADVDQMYRDWLTDLKALRAVCEAGADNKRVYEQLKTSSASFGAFFSAVDAIVGLSDDKNQGIPSAVSRGDALVGQAPGAMVPQESASPTAKP